MLKDKINVAYFRNSIGGKILYWMTFAFLFFILFSGITLIVPDTAILFITPNVINFSVAAIISGLLLLLILNHSINYNGLVTSLGFIALYFGYLCLTSLWAQYPDLTITALKFELLNIFSFCLFYLCSLNNKTKIIIRLFRSMIMPAIIIASITYVNNPDVERLGSVLFYSLVSTVLLFKIMSNKSKIKLDYLLLTLVVISLIVSKHKASLLAFFVGALLITIFQNLKRMGKIIHASWIFVIIFLFIFLTSIDVQKLSLSTYARISGDDVSYGNLYIQGELKDVVRESVYNFANELIMDNWLLGIGYMNFMPKYGESFGSLISMTVTGKDLYGISIHNTFQAWLLEGGIFLVIIVFLLLFRYFKILLQHIESSKRNSDVVSCKMLIVLMIQILVFGLYHQIHGVQIFWMILGYAFALKYKAPFPDALFKEHQ